MPYNRFSPNLTFTFLSEFATGWIARFCGVWLRCNSSEWNNHSASLRLSLHPQAVTSLCPTAGFRLNP